jgi:aspartate racemase
MISSGVSIEMKTIGLLGGMSWESSAVYYRLLNEMTRDRFGGLHSAKIIMYSCDFEEVVHCQKSNDWAKAAELLIDASKALEQGGAELLVICTNTMHKLADEIQSHIAIPLVHIVDVIAQSATRQGIKTVGVLGTKYTMEDGFYQERLSKRGIQAIVPNAVDRDVVHDIIFDELCKGVIREESRSRYVEIIQKMVHQGAEAVVLGCTEIPLLIQQNHIQAPVLDTTYLHAERAMEIALQVDGK